MVRTVRFRGGAALAVWLLAGCAASVIDGGGADTGATPTDLPATPTDTGALDTSAPPPTDAPDDLPTPLDTGSADTGRADTGFADTGIADTSRADTGFPDTGSAPVDTGPPPECSAGQSRPCGAAVGVCTAGTQRCEGGRWGACSGQGPVTERCHDGLDNDCDGSVDEGCSCPVGNTLTVDNDLSGSGYREESSNWATWSTDACRGTYRYLSHTVGDTTRRGRAIWQPSVRYTGYYRVTTGFRASTNRTTDADYIVEDDRGSRVRRSINQQSGDGCVRVDLGLAWCRVGGTCRLVLDGTDDSQSDAADETTFRLERCDAPTSVPTGCAGIAARAGFELCYDGGDVCRGVFTDGSGCTAFCAAAGMVCTARYGASPGCNREAAAIPCGASNGHLSDWCECAAR